MSLKCPPGSTYKWSTMYRLTKKSTDGYVTIAPKQRAAQSNCATNNDMVIHGAYCATMEPVTTAICDDDSTPASDLVSTAGSQHANGVEQDFGRGLLFSTDETISPALPTKRPIRRRVSAISGDDDAQQTVLKQEPEAEQYASDRTDLSIALNPFCSVTSDSAATTSPGVQEIAVAATTSQEMKTIRSELRLLRAEVVSLRRNYEANNRLLQRLMDNETLSLPLPFVSIDELKTFDSQLHDPSVKTRLIPHFFGVTGNTVRQLVRDTMQRLMLRSVAAKITYSGAGHTFAFKRTNINGIIHVFIGERLGNSVSYERISACIRAWLRSVRHNKPTAVSSTDTVMDTNTTDLGPEFHG
ncbi:unnamed protein product [Dicrocoelium dendriticum]|nr:unnamed protein product [Dicrocoelium dendriticum]